MKLKGRPVRTSPLLNNSYGNVSIDVNILKLILRQKVYFANQSSFYTLISIYVLYKDFRSSFGFTLH